MSSTSDDLSYCRRTFAKGEINTYTRWSSCMSLHPASCRLNNVQ